MVSLINRCWLVSQTMVRNTIVPFAATILCVCLMLPATSLGRGVRTHRFLWSAKVSSTYPPNSPLVVRLGDMLFITCPANATSNIWLQTHRLQFDHCDCTAPAEFNSSSPECTLGPTTRSVCQDEVVISITTDSNKLKSALSFEPDATYYLISYSSGNQSLAGFTSNSISGGECLNGFKMVVQVQAQTTENYNQLPIPNDVTNTKMSITQFGLKSSARGIISTRTTLFLVFFITSFAVLVE